MSDRGASRAPGPRALFYGFFRISLHAFGGVLPWTRRELVERRAWLDAQEFTDLLGLCQFLPGPNIGNLAIVVGSRFAGWRGALAATLGLFAAPVAIVIALGMLYADYGNTVLLGRALGGVAAAAAGLIAAMAMRMAAPWRDGLSHEKDLRAPLFCGLSFIAVALLRLPLPGVMAVLAPLSIWFAGSSKP